MFFLGLAIAIIVTIIFCSILVDVKKSKTSQVIEQSTTTQEVIQLTHSQEVWMGALEWCESRGDIKAINEIDRDGTPSYYAFQFKPETFKRYAIKYGLMSDCAKEFEAWYFLADYRMQKIIVMMMINDPDVVWTTEFPGCVKKLGPPPRYDK